MPCRLRVSTYTYSGEKRSMEKLSIKWREFEANIRGHFISLREDKKIFDVTLATEDGQQIQAHKIILSAGSNFSSDIFIRNNNVNMLIYLKGMESPLLENILDFLYNGEVFLSQDNLQAFLDIGRHLKVKGIIGDTAETAENHESLAAVKNTPPDKVKKETEKSLTRKEIGFEDNFLEGPEERDFRNSSNSFKNNRGSSDLDTEGLKLQIEQMIEKTDGEWNCKVCQKASTSKSHIQSHAETHIGGLSFSCPICGKTFSTRAYLHNHTVNIHSELSSCDTCDKTGMTKTALYVHKRRHHK